MLADTDTKYPYQKLIYTVQVKRLYGRVATAGLLLLLFERAVIQTVERAEEKGTKVPSDVHDDLCTSLEFAIGARQTGGGGATIITRTLRGVTS